MASRKKKATKLSGLKNDGLPNAYWRRFKQRLDKYDETPPANWKDEHALGHILKRYKDQVGVDFSLSHSGPPTKSKEIYCIRRMILALGTEDGQVIKNYIDWLFDTIVIPKNITISSIAFFFTADFIFKFKQKLRRNNKITRTTQLPVQYCQLLTNLNITDISTYGDLAFAKLAIDQDPDNIEYAIYIEMFNKLSGVGLDIDQLKSLKD